MKKPVEQALRLCLVTDSTLCSELGVMATIKAAVAGGVTMVQLRDKQASTAERTRLAKAIVDLLRESGVPLIVNDDVEAGLASMADGVHVGQGDMPAAEVRKLLGPDKLVGVSCGSDAELAAIDPDIVDYVGLGPVFATNTKSGHSPPIGIDGLQRLVNASRTASIAIGGLKAHHIVPVMATGVNGIAVVSAICGQPDPQAATRHLLTGGVA